MLHNTYITIMYYIIYIYILYYILLLFLRTLITASINRSLFYDHNRNNKRQRTIRPVIYDEYNVKEILTDMYIYNTV